MGSRSTLRRRLLQATGGDDTIEPYLEENEADASHRGNTIGENEDVTETDAQETEELLDLSSDIELSDSSIDTDQSDSENSVCSERSIMSNSSGNSSNDNSSECSENEEDSNSLYGTSVKTTESVLKVLKLYVEERWTKKSLAKTLVLIKGLLPQPNSMPGSLKSLLRFLKEMTNVRQESEHYYCSNCQTPKTCKVEMCSNFKCSDKEKTGTFFQFSVDDQVKHMLEQRNLASAVEFYHRQSSSGEDICDIRDGSEYKAVMANLGGVFDIVLVWNTDGVALSGSSNQELWPVLAFVSNVPPRLRSSYILVAGIYVGPKKPVMNMFLKPLVESMQKSYDNGGINWIHPVTKQITKSVIVMPVLVVDAPAKAGCLNIMQYNAVYGCGVCEQKAGKVETTYRRANSPNVRKRIRRCFLYKEEPARIRTKQRMVHEAFLAERQNKPVKGVICESVISNMPLLDLGVCAAAEYMHNVALGVVRYILDLMLNVPGPWNISHKVDEINSFMSKCIKVPDFVRRLPRASIRDLQKASEYRNFLLFYSLPAFENHLEPKYFQHWMLLVISMHILLSERITNDDLKAADIMLKCFVRDFGTLYEEKYYTYNIHNLIHAVLLVKRWGPLWATSAFIFEDYNGFMKNHIFGSKHYARELLNNLQIIQSVTILENIVQGRQFSFVSNDSKESIINFSNRLKYESLSDIEKNVIPLEKDISLYQRAEVSSKVYTSKYYDSEKKRINSIVKFSHNNCIKYGQILFFVESKSKPAVCVLREFRIQHLNILFHVESRYRVKNIVPVVDTELLVVCPIDSLIQKLLKVGQYVCMIPNSFEINL